MGLFALRFPAMPIPPAALLADLRPVAALAGYLVLIAAAAFLGGASVSLFALGHRATQVLLSFTGGVLLGVGLLHLLPHAAYELGGDIEATMGWALIGFFAMFLLERAFHAHAHHAADSACEHDHGPDHHHHHHAAAATGSRWAWCGALAGLTLHSLADGAALAASVNADQTAGFATFLAILLHKPLDSAIIATLMISAGATRGMRTAVNLGYAAVVPLGAAGFLASLPLFGGQREMVVGIALALAGGAFVCIAAADLLPEVQFHAHDRLLLTTALVLGLGLAWGMTVAERSTHGPDGHGHHHHEHAPRPAPTDG
jgi:zinc and cadmium transporter